MSLCENPKHVTDFDQIRRPKYSLYDGAAPSTLKRNPSLDIEFLAFSGGGVSGLSYIGVLMEFQKRNLLEGIKYLVGSSSGALICTLVALGASPEFILHKLTTVNLSSFFTALGHEYKKNNPLSKFLCGYYGIPEFIKNFGVCSSQPFMNWYASCILELGYSCGLTFAELYEKTGIHLVITTCCLNTKTTLYLSRSSYPHMKIVEAVNMSILLPFILQPVQFDDPHLPESVTNNCPIYCIDGGMLDNTALNACDVTSPEGEIVGFNRRAIAFMPVEEGRWTSDFTPIHNIVDFSLSVIRTMHNSIHIAQGNQEYFWERIVPIETSDVSAIDFDIRPESVAQLIASGQNATAKYLDRRAQMIQEKGPLPENLFIPNLRLQCCGVESLDDSLISGTKIYQTNPTNFNINKIAIAHLFEKK